MSGNARSYSQTASAPTTTPAEVLAENRNRNAVIFFNTGTVELKIGIGTALIPIAVGSHLAFTDGDAPINAITAASSTGTGALAVWEA